jgi:4-hydroxy-tetrahydrodipicolinate reductase
MNILLLGRGKTGSLVGEVARQRGHEIQVVGAAENADCAALAAEKLREVDVVIDFTAPSCVAGHIDACVSAGKNMVVGTTGWHGEVDRIRNLVESRGTGFVYAANFSLGVNLFLEVARAAAAALRHDYSGQIFERHHVHKKDAPSGTAIAIQRVIGEASGQKKDHLEITSFREGDVVGMHEVVLESTADRIYLCHDAKSRQGFADGAVRAAEWLAGKKGFYDFKDVWREL